MSTYNAPRPLANPSGKNPVPNPGETYAHLHRPLQFLAAILSGFAVPGLRPYFTLNWKRWLAMYSLGMAGSLALTVFLAGRPHLWPLLPLAWMLLTGYLRAGATSVIHMASHDILTPWKRLDRFLADLIGILFWLLPFDKYFEDHRKGHHPWLATEKDPDLVWIREQGFRPGLPRGWYWKRYVRLLLDPVFHFRYVASRLHANLGSGPPGRRILFLATLPFYAIPFRFGWGLEFTLAWLVPLMPAFSIGGLTQNLSEHSYVRHEGRLEMLTVDRYFGVPAPAEGSRPWRWAVWGLTMLWQGLVRHFVAPFDLSNHRLHHLQPRHPNWYNHPYARMEAAAKNPASWHNAETWGFHQALDRTFSAFSSLPPTAKLGQPDTYRAPIE